MKRRYFLASAAAACACSPGPRASLRFFGEAEARTLNAWLDCLIPADDVPGAVEAGVIHYIDRQLTRRFRRQQPAYRAALRRLDQLAMELAGAAFADLDFEKRTELLESFERTEARAFNMVLDHCMQGFYGSPRHGGNKDYVSWRMLGVPVSPVRGRQHYTAEGDQG